MPTEAYTIRKRYSWLPSIVVEIDCEPDAADWVKLGLAIAKARVTGANLTGANLRGANLTGAVLTGAVLMDAKIVRVVGQGQRLDGYSFFCVEIEGGAVMVRAGCRWLSTADYRVHVACSYPDTRKAVETLAILDGFDALVAFDRDALAKAGAS